MTRRIVFWGSTLITSAFILASVPSFAGSTGYSSWVFERANKEQHAVIAACGDIGGFSRKDTVAPLSFHQVYRSSNGGLGKDAADACPTFFVSTKENARRAVIYTVGDGHSVSGREWRQARSQLAFMASETEMPPIVIQTEMTFRLIVEHSRFIEILNY